MKLPSGIPISFTQHHSNFYTYSQLSSIFEKRFDYYKVFDFIDNYIIDGLLIDTSKTTDKINIHGITIIVIYTSPTSYHRSRRQISKQCLA